MTHDYYKLPNACIIGAQYGDEGKAKIVDAIASKYDIIARYQGGSNAGHTVVVNDTKYIFHQIPSAALHPGKTVVIGNGCVVDAIALAKEVRQLQGLGFDFKLVLSGKAHLVRPYHKEIDGKDTKIGTTKQGIGPAYADKVNRKGVRVKDYLALPFGADNTTPEENEALHFLEQFVVEDVGEVIAQLTNSGKKLLAEGAQGTMLDIDHGDYPFVTSSSPTIGGVFTGLGIGPKQIDDIIGVFKPYVTRVGEGEVPYPMGTEEDALLRELGGEYGATTGRPRRCSYLDIKALRYACRVNGFTGLALTKIDVFAEFTQRMAKDGQLVGYVDKNGYKTLIKPFSLKDGHLGEDAYRFIWQLQREIGVPIKYVSTGADRSAFAQLL